ncbi:DNA/RNA helicase domain-containing protein [Cytobacillus sp. FSL H8-0458]|uniref:DNA/RNA helicase domain-containing protein n=1 Tax=Cytobacillus sp. FSL H8-0458 TaxID=2975346 RepID=UPI004046EF8C
MGGCGKVGRPQKGVDDPNRLRVNSYRVLMTRGRDGLIVYVPQNNIFNSVYTVLRQAGMEDII